MAQIDSLGILGMRFLYWRLPSWVERMQYIPALNYGYEGGDGDSLSLLGNAENRAQLRLYYVAAGSFLLERSLQRPLEVAEIGCGLGVGASFLASSLKDGLHVLQGIDTSGAAVDFCRKRYKGDPKISFQQGDAMHLPLEDGSVDALVNVESSHMYPDMRGFLNEASRVLRPGGYFLWTDFRKSGEQEETLRAIARQFDILEKVDITANVLRALESEEEEKRKEKYLAQLLSSLSLPERMAMRLALKYVRNFMGMRGSDIARNFKARDILYLRVAAQKALS